MFKRLLIIAKAGMHKADIDVTVCLAKTVADFLSNLQRFTEMLKRLWFIA